MKRSIARWTTTMTAAALIAVPALSFAQTVPPQTQPPTPPAQTAPAQPALDQDAAKQHLTAARNALSEMTQLPAAQQLTGEARTQVSQLISNFNELITTNADWKASYAKLSANMEALLGPQVSDEARASGTAGAVGTSGTVAIDPAIKAKLTEFRGHLEKFEKAAGGAEPSAAAAAAPTASTPPSATTPPAATPAAPAEPAAASEPRRDQEQILNHIAAIEAIIGAQPPASGTTAGTGAASSGALTLTAAQIDQLRNHINELKKLVQK
jgi:hypothetical protein